MADNIPLYEDAEATGSKRGGMAGLTASCRKPVKRSVTGDVRLFLKGAIMLYMLSKSYDCHNDEDVAPFFSIPGKFPSVIPPVAAQDSCVSKQETF